MKLLVTGGTGFIGGHFINETPKEMEIYAIRRNKNKTKVKINRKVIWLDKDLHSLSSKDLKGIDSIIHFATTGVSPQKASWEDLYNINVKGTLLLLRNAAEAEVKRVLIAGSYFEYGFSANKYKYIPVTAPLLPISPYGSSKAAAFEMAYAFCLNAKLPLFYNRIFSAYGEGQYYENLFPSLKNAANNGEDFTIKNSNYERDFIEIKQVVKMFLDDLKIDITDNLKPSIKNICSGKGTSIYEFSNYWWKTWKAKGELKFINSTDKNDLKRFVGEV
tara:strand:- start:734 stop:1558 length:825 start_codon:yes stop_codon:yes gene_type:complete